MTVLLSYNQSRGQAMVSKGQEVTLIWFGGVQVTSYKNTQVETPRGALQFVVTFQLPMGAPGIQKKAYRLPLYWQSEFGTFIGEGTVTPTGQVIARFHVSPDDR